MKPQQSHRPPNMRDINSMEELQYHKQRLDLATEFLEDKIEDNLLDIKRQLSPKYLFRTMLSSIISMIGRRRKHKADDGTEEEEDDGNPLMNGIAALLKAAFRAF